jgi:hypothetical protein
MDGFFVTTQKREMNMRFGTRDILSPYRAGSLKT